MGRGRQDDFFPKKEGGHERELCELCVEGDGNEEGRRPIERESTEEV